MRLVVFGLSISSAWGNGHATLLRGLFRELHGMGHEVHFFEKDVPYYASHRDARDFCYVDLHLYSDWGEIRVKAAKLLATADAAMVTSYCGDGAEASELILCSNVSRSIFYDMDTPVTLSRLERGETVAYLPSDGLTGFDLVLSYTGGRALEDLQSKLGARRTATLYGWVDPEAYHNAVSRSQFESNLSYLGTYSADRQAAFEKLLLEPARIIGDRQFTVGGAMYSDRQLWPNNIRYFEHVPPADHCAFYSSSCLTLNITRGSMVAMGYCPSGRLFEAAACGTAVLSDWWLGLDSFFKPGEEILIAASTNDAISAITSDESELKGIAKRARQRALACHTARIRAERLVELIEDPVTDPVQGVVLTKGA
ncbi:MAG: glycosyltransferase [Acidobacteriaceae bacterium]|nr:glycosyltransferase [Acidobacteriaceae bacterium]MBV9502118.1 glycosyltransferase [Acidobacteriaceae bacterium]